MNSGGARLALPRRLVGAQVLHGLRGAVLLREREHDVVPARARCARRARSRAHWLQRRRLLRFGRFRDFLRGRSALPLRVVQRGHPSATERSEGPLHEGQLLASRWMGNKVGNKGSEVQNRRANKATIGHCIRSKLVPSCFRRFRVRGLTLQQAVVLTMCSLVFWIERIRTSRALLTTFSPTHPIHLQWHFRAQMLNA